ncbi:MAG: murein transglycosylase [Rhodospirillales bacterium]|nr:MAG: murein transglycosylase [Rhodospirillales bacterium]
MVPTLVAAALIAFGLVAGCATEPPQRPIIPGTLGFSHLAGWKDDDHAAALRTFLVSCRRLEQMPSERPTGLEGPGGRIGDWLPACRAARQVGDGPAARHFFESWFQPMAVVGVGETGLFTGYYEPELRGALRPSGRYRVPLHAVPDDLVTVRGDGGPVVSRRQDGRLVPYHDRAAIQRGILAGRNLELLWVDDPVDAFFLHVQGSGRVVLDDGRVVRVGFAGRNGHPYVPIGRVLVDKGALTRDEVSMQSIRAWLHANPGEADAVMGANPSYIFFQVIEGDGPRGALGVVLTPERSLAVDPAFVPLGAPVWVDTVDPLQPAQPLRRLMVAQDTGSAIKGPGRGDVFWGAGRMAAERAGRMRSAGRTYLLVPRQAPPSS